MSYVLLLSINLTKAMDMSVFDDLVNDIYSHTANFSYDNDSNTFGIINYTKKELQALSLKELQAIYKEYCGE